ncbi:hypothetical protein BD324DRAFT_649886 [Kockovaella imperatae]|uniref:Uncharacterized protein n=1 Tax=Kockovaella imperatae TaxID=4999 RepID=A0A1Y1UKE4_9TREE|nr:hypothetical protein BD324DRAFT_649886 [Kockovaella imperatae]ORX38523.1 hypothetical protein BD324DRAFT_649886 [Kockovaella imperatae]
MSFAPPAGPPPPPRHPIGSSTNRQAARQDSVDQAVLDEEPPPAYHSVVSGGASDAVLDAGPSRMDFSGPPPLPERLQAVGTGSGIAHHVTGVGEGYGRRPPHATGFESPFADQFQSSQGTSSYPVSERFEAPAGPPPGKSSGGYAGPSTHSSRPPSPPSHPSSSGGAGSSSRPGSDLTPTDVPTPGRPLLHNGMMLVYPKGHFCTKCYNTGYKANDPRNPHEADWRKYGKHYTSALAHSYSVSSGPGASSAADNFQRPLPNHQPAGPGSMYGGAAPPPSPNKWNTYPGHSVPTHQHAPPPGSWQGHPGPGQGNLMMHPPQPHLYPSHTMTPPPGAIVLQAGDPRIGGR